MKFCTDHEPHWLLDTGYFLAFYVAPPTDFTLLVKYLSI